MGSEQNTIRHERRSCEVGGHQPLSAPVEYSQQLSQLRALSRLQPPREPLIAHKAPSLAPRRPDMTWFLGAWHITIQITCEGQVGVQESKEDPEPPPQGGKLQACRLSRSRLGRCSMPWLQRARAMATESSGAQAGSPMSGRSNRKFSPSQGWGLRVGPALSVDQAPLLRGAQLIRTTVPHSGLHIPVNNIHAIHLSTMLPVQRPAHQTGI